MLWFKAFSNTRNSTLSKLMLRHGHLVYSLFYYCRESVAENITSKNINFEIKVDSEVIADRFKVPLESIENAMKDLIEEGVFFKNNDNQVFDYGLAECIENSIVKNPQLKKIQAWIKKNRKKVIHKLSTIHDNNQIPETLPNYSDFPDFPGYDEIRELFPENPENSGRNYSSRKIPENFPENPGQIRLDIDKIRLDKTRLEGEGEENPGNFPGKIQSTPPPPISEKIRYYHWVFLTAEEFKDIQNIYGTTLTNDYINRLDNWIGSHPADRTKWISKNHYYTLLDWMQKDSCTKLPQVKKKICPGCGKKHNDALGRWGKCNECTTKEIEEDRKRNFDDELKTYDFDDEIIF